MPEIMLVSGNSSSNSAKIDMVIVQDIDDLYKSSMFKTNNGILVIII